MANQLELYNNALLLIGQRKLSSTTEAIESRYALDNSYDSEAVRYCLELARPAFATTTSTLSSGTAGTSFAYTHTLPCGY